MHVLGPGHGGVASCCLGLLIKWWQVRAAGQLLLPGPALACSTVNTEFSTYKLNGTVHVSNLRHTNLRVIILIVGRDNTFHIIQSQVSHWANWSMLHKSLSESHNLLRRVCFNHSMWKSNENYCDFCKIFVIKCRKYIIYIPRPAHWSYTDECG